LQSWKYLADGGGIASCAAAQRMQHPSGSCYQANYQIP
jgi:hypothetical protein